jgi:polyisoprenoid-binding protein YceI
MSDLATQPFAGTYRGQPAASTFAFAIRHSETLWFRGVMPEAEASLCADGDGLVLEGSALVESISVREPPELRAHLLAADFFDAERHPEVGFRSTDLRLTGEERLELEGELTIKGITRPLYADGRYSAPRRAAFGEVAALELHTAFDRREFGFDWQAEMPGGGDAVGWEVQLDVDLLLVAEADAGGDTPR